MHVPRSQHVRTIRALLRDNPVVAILGARQVGKTTLARQVLTSWRGKKFLFDLEDPVDRRKLEDPGLVLREAQGLVVLDEVQRLPDVFRLLRVLADRRPVTTRFLVLGSASPELLRQSSESLAGRIAFHELNGLHQGEVADLRGYSVARLWLRGGFPASYLARNDDVSLRWRQDFVRTFLQQDLPALQSGVPTAQIERFWLMLAHWHGNLWNAAELARSLGTGESVARRHLDLLAQTFVLRVLPPWHENLAKRQVKSPKVYIADSGIAHALLGIRNHDELIGHPKSGATWEGFLLTQVVQRLGAQREECFFWSTHQGAELDLLVVRGKRRIGFEMKRSEAPEVTKSMRIAMQDLGLDELVVLHGGKDSWTMGDRMRAVAAIAIPHEIAPIQ